MKTEPLLKAIILGGSIGLIANPLWAGGNSMQSPHAGQEKMTPSYGSDLSTGVTQHDQQTIMEAQQKLQEKGFEPGQINGVMDSQTQQAIARFQSENNLPVTGTLDEQTAAQLGVEVSSQSRSSESPRWSGEHEGKPGDAQNLFPRGETQGSSGIYK